MWQNCRVDESMICIEFKLLLNFQWKYKFYIKFGTFTYIRANLVVFTIVLISPFQFYIFRQTSPLWPVICVFTYCLIVIAFSYLTSRKVQYQNSWIWRKISLVTTSNDSTYTQVNKKIIQITLNIWIMNIFCQNVHIEKL